MTKPPAGLGKLPAAWLSKSTLSSQVQLEAIAAGIVRVQTWRAFFCRTIHMQLIQIQKNKGYVRQKLS
jgi:hypothetical protein